MRVWRAQSSSRARAGRVGERRGWFRSSLGRNCGFPLRARLAAAVLPFPPAFPSPRAVCLRPSYSPSQSPVLALCRGTLAGGVPLFERQTPLYPRGPRSGPGYSVPVHQRLFGPIRPTRPHIATSPLGGLYAMPLLCGCAWAAREWFRAFADRSVPSCRPLRPRRARRLHEPVLHRRLWPSPTEKRLGALDTPGIPFSRAVDFEACTVRFRYDLTTGSPPCVDPACRQPTGAFTPRLSPIRSPFTALGITTMVTG